ncbi:MAG: hypothetical protein FLDDKLPJ_01188 [Phycisphaerae bacterium]|nr:hypothetical protein [Phycisphaerae bacterium]
MSEVFPFNFPVETAVYLFLLTLSWALHFFFVGYVVAGSVYLAAASLRRSNSGDADPIEAVVRDWMPSALGAAITAGVAPLLFVQVVYQVEFYTAGLLISTRFMLILPALITAFYLFYVQKTKRFANWRRPTRAGIALAALACVFFVGTTWMRVHWLTVNKSSWEDLGNPPLDFGNGHQALARGGVFFAAAILLGSAVVRAQLGSPGIGGSPLSGAARRLSRIMGFGMAAMIAALAGAAFVYRAWPGPWMALTARADQPYWVLMLVAVLIFGVFIPSRPEAARARLRARAQLLAAFFIAVALAGIREGLRSRFAMMSTLHPRHFSLAEKGGWAVFAAFAAVNAACIAAAIRIARSRCERQA